jgi:hypothetical protein
MSFNKKSIFAFSLCCSFFRLWFRFPSRSGLWSPAREICFSCFEFFPPALSSSLSRSLTYWSSIPSLDLSIFLVQDLVSARVSERRVGFDLCFDFFVPRPGFQSPRQGLVFGVVSSFSARDFSSSREGRASGFSPSVFGRNRARSGSSAFDLGTRTLVTAWVPRFSRWVFDLDFYESSCSQISVPAGNLRCSCPWLVIPLAR